MSVNAPTAGDGWMTVAQAAAHGISETSLRAKIKSGRLLVRRDGRRVLLRTVDVQTLTRGQRTVTCRDCGQPFTYPYRNGAPRRQCDGCRHPNAAAKAAERAQHMTRFDTAREEAVADACRGLTYGLANPRRLVEAARLALAILQSTATP